MFWFFGQEGCGGLSSWTKDRTHSPCIGRWSLNHWTTREVPVNYFVVLIPWSQKSCLSPSPLHVGYVKGKACVLLMFSIIPASCPTQKKTAERRKHTVSTLQQTLSAATLTAKSAHAECSAQRAQVLLWPLSLLLYSPNTPLPSGCWVHPHTLRVCGWWMMTLVQFRTWANFQWSSILDITSWSSSVIVLCGTSHWSSFLSFSLSLALETFSFSPSFLPFQSLLPDDISVLTNLTLKGFPSALDLLWGISWILLNKSDNDLWWHLGEVLKFIFLLLPSIS